VVPRLSVTPADPLYVLEGVGRPGFSVGRGGDNVSGNSIFETPPKKEKTVPRSCTIHPQGHDSSVTLVDFIADFIAEFGVRILPTTLYAGRHSVGAGVVD
jgi:hypothetical protein